MNGAIEQVRTWDRYFIENPGEKKRIFGAVKNFRLILVTGTIEDWSTEKAMKWRAHFNSSQNIELRSMDVFKKSLEQYANTPDAFWSFEENPISRSSVELTDFWSHDGYMDLMRKVFS